MTREEINDFCEMKSQFTESQIQKMQEMEQAEIEKAYELGKEDKIKVLDKIRAEIKALSNANPSYWHSGDMVDRDDVIEIIDKYKAESEDKE